MVVSADVVVADDTETARTWRPATATGCTRSAQATAPSPTRTPTPSNRCPTSSCEVVKDRTATQFVGDADEVATKLETLQRVTDADELVVTSVTHGHADRLHGRMS